MSYQDFELQLVGGPLDGFTHELQGVAEFGIPNVVGVPFNSGIAWYNVDGDRGHFSKLEPLPEAE